MSDMHDFFAILDALAKDLEAAPGLDGVGVLVDRSLDLRAETNSRLYRTTGAMITLGLTGWEVPANQSGQPMVDLDLMVCLWFCPTAQRGVSEMGELLSALICATWHWRPGEAVAGYCRHKLLCQRGHKVQARTPDERLFVIYGFSARLRIFLQPPPSP